MLKAYSYRDIQMFGQLLDRAKDEGISLDQLRGMVSAVQAERLGELKTLSAPPPRSMACPARRIDGSSCPGQLVPVRNAEGLSLFGCPLCRYSEVR